MLLLRGFLDRLLLLCAVIAGGLVPGFISQYRQRLGGRLDQAQLDLQPWQKLADQSFQGDLDKLVQYHLSSTDPTFHAEGAVIRALVETVHNLRQAADALHGTLWQQLQYLAGHLDAALARATYNDWIPTFSLSADGIAFALAFGLAVWLVFHALWLLVDSGSRIARRHREAPAL